MRSGTTCFEEWQTAETRASTGIRMFAAVTTADFNSCIPRILSDGSLGHSPVDSAAESDRRVVAASLYAGFSCEARSRGDCRALTMKIPVFHDGKYGTAIDVGAATVRTTTAPRPERSMRLYAVIDR